MDTKLRYLVNDIGNLTRFENGWLDVDTPMSKDDGILKKIKTIS